MKALSFEGQLALKLLLSISIGAAGGAAVALWLKSVWAAVLTVGVIGIIPAIVIARRQFQPIRQLLRALSAALASYRDGDFSTSLVLNRRDELGELIAAHNELGQVLRERHRQLAEKELLLETAVQNSPAALLLVDGAQRIVYSNLAARHMMNEGSSCNGLAFQELLAKCPEALSKAVEQNVDGLFQVAIEGVEESYHISSRRFLLRGREHTLYLIKRLTRELSRQEVSIWKKLIRVLSHELNNSLGPISSLSHTGEEMLRRGQHERLGEVLEGIGERARHLQTFIESYASLARVPTPRPREVEWQPFIVGLALHWPFKLQQTWPNHPGWFDPTQLSQALINLLKNARESASAPDDIELHVCEMAEGVSITLLDRGSGMSDAILANALLPFYSTKRSGTGLGLPLTREIVEAHGGRLSLCNREGGGACVRIVLPSRGRSPLSP